MGKEEFKNKIKTFFFVRLHMFLIMTGMMAVGFGLARALLFLGVTSLVARYSLALIGSYFAFICLVRIWLVYIFGFKSTPKEKNTLQDSAEAGLDVLDAVSWHNFSNLSRRETYSGGGGSSAGGGASDSWGPSKLFDADFDGDGALPVLVGIVLVGVLLLVFGIGVYAVYEAPNLLAEIALEMAISLGLLHKIRNQEGNWFLATLKSTGPWFCGFLIVVVIALNVITNYYPEVKNSSQIIELIKQIPASLSIP